MRDELKLLFTDAMYLMFYQFTHHVHSKIEQRCLNLQLKGSISECPICLEENVTLKLLPMNFSEIDEANNSSSVVSTWEKRCKRRKRRDDGSISNEGNDSQLCRDMEIYRDESGLRTGRWTVEETAFVDFLIIKFESGKLQINDSIKLNDFLACILKSKQSRLTKKMKNAKLSTKLYKRVGKMFSDEAQKFSELEKAFCYSIHDQRERAEMKFHMKKEWREKFSALCLSIGQQIQVDDWLNSVEEMDRRKARSKENFRIARRKLMMSFAFRQNAENLNSVVFSKGNKDSTKTNTNDFALVNLKPSPDLHTMNTNHNVSPCSTSPFLAKVISFMQCNFIPFEHVDVWVPSIIDQDQNYDGSCRLCFAGCATADSLVVHSKRRQSISAEERSNLSAFGAYSHEFSFRVGCGLPGRVYQCGIPTWEQSVQNAPQHHFERCGGAMKWGIKTVVGIPISCPNVGRIIVSLYSRYDREKNEELVGRLIDEFQRFMPVPKWNLVVDIGKPLIEDVIPENHIHICNDPSLLSRNYSYDENVKQLIEEVDTVNHNQVYNNSLLASKNYNLEESAKPRIENENTENQILVYNSSSLLAKNYTYDENPSPDDSRASEVVTLLGEYIPSDSHSALGDYIQGFIAIRLLLLKSSLSMEESMLASTILNSFSSYLSTGRTRRDIAVLLARDYMFLTQNYPQAQLNNFGTSIMGAQQIDFETGISPNFFT